MSINDVRSALERQGKYEEAEAEAMNRQTLTLSKTVLGRKHLVTLISVDCLVHLLATSLL
jgi:hypothetical protein